MSQQKVMHPETSEVISGGVDKRGYKSRRFEDHLTTKLWDRKHHESTNPSCGPSPVLWRQPACA